MLLQAKIKSGQKNILTVSSNTLLIELEIDPNEAIAHDDKYILKCSDDQAVYQQTKTVKDDQIPEDEFLTLRFSRIVLDHNYTLEIDPGADEGEPFCLFDDVPIQQLLSGNFAYEGSTDEGDEERVEHIYNDSEDAELPYDDDELEVESEVGYDRDDENEEASPISADDRLDEEIVENGDVEEKEEDVDIYEEEWDDDLWEEE